MTSIATELATPSVTDVRTDTLRRLIYKDYSRGDFELFSAPQRRHVAPKRIKFGVEESTYGGGGLEPRKT